MQRPQFPQFPVRSDGGFLVASVRLRNGHPKDVRTRYKFRWFDLSGVEVQPEGRVWEERVVRGGDAETLSATAPDMSAAGYSVRVRLAK